MQNVEGVQLLMRHLLFITLFELFYVLLYSQAIASFRASQNSSTIFSGKEIRITSQGIQIRAKERPLLGILQQIQLLSGISFLCSPEVGEVLITATIDAPDWPTTVQQLLRSFSTAETWSQEGKQLRQVTILKHSEEQLLLSETPHLLKNDSQKLEGVYLLEPPPPSLLPPIPPPPPFSPEFLK